MSDEVKHTPEPWAKYDNDLPKTLSAADYERARAAINACAGIPTKQLEAGSVAKLVEVAEVPLSQWETAHRVKWTAGDQKVAMQRLRAVLRSFQDTPK